MTTSTPTGTFKIREKHVTTTMDSQSLGSEFELADVPWVEYFHNGYALHAAYWHTEYGRPRSHGCINLATQKQNSRSGVNEDAGWLYQWASLGVPVTVYRESPREKTTLSETGAEKTPQN